MKKVLALLVAGAVWAGAALAAESTTLELIMSEADWIGAAPQNPWWSDDGTAVYYQQKRPGADILDVYRLSLDSGTAVLVDRSAAPADAGRERVYEARRIHVAWVDDGDVLLKRLGDGTVTRITRTVADESAPLFSADGALLYFQRDSQYLSEESGWQLTDTVSARPRHLRRGRRAAPGGGLDAL